MQHPGPRRRPIFFQRTPAYIGLLEVGVGRASGPSPTTNRANGRWWVSLRSIQPTPEGAIIPRHRRATSFGSHDSRPAAPEWKPEAQAKATRCSCESQGLQGKPEAQAKATRRSCESQGLQGKPEAQAKATRRSCESQGLQGKPEAQAKATRRSCFACASCFPWWDIRLASTGVRRRPGRRPPCSAKRSRRKGGGRPDRASRIGSGRPGRPAPAHPA